MRATHVALLAVGALGTIPLAIAIFGRPRAKPKTTEVAPGLRVPDAPVADVAPARLA